MAVTEAMRHRGTPESRPKLLKNVDISAQPGSLSPELVLFEKKVALNGALTTLAEVRTRQEEDLGLHPIKRATEDGGKEKIPFTYSRGRDVDIYAGLEEVSTLKRIEEMEEDLEKLTGKTDKDN